jgi:hypothetical protein
MSNIPPIKSGDRIRITRVAEGTITAISPTGFTLDNGWRYNTTHHSHRYDTTVEVLEPAFERSAVYIDADGDFFLRCGSPDDPWMSFDGVSYGENYPTRPLRKLVPEATGA